MNYWREEPLEVDAIRRDLGKWAIEVKTDGIAAVELRGLAEFVRRNREYRPLVLCDQPDAIAVERLGIQAMRWQNFLLTGPPKT